MPCYAFVSSTTKVSPRHIGYAWTRICYTHDRHPKILHQQDVSKSMLKLNKSSTEPVTQRWVFICTTFLDGNTRSGRSTAKMRPVHALCPTRYTEGGLWVEKIQTARGAARILLPRRWSEMATDAICISVLLPTAVHACYCSHACHCDRSTCASTTCRGKVRKAAK